MNTLNYATLPASKRLVEAGIVLETEAYWRVWPAYRDAASGCELVTAKEKKQLQAIDNFDRETSDAAGCLYFPAPCMAEVWRELPSDDWELYQLIRKYLMFRGLDFEDYAVAMELIRIARNTDAPIDLLIWVRKEADHADK